jgi:hypothetical protein
LASFRYGKRIVMVILVTSHKGRNMLGRDKFGIMA